MQYEAALDAFGALGPCAGALSLARVVTRGLGCIVALCYRSPTLDQIHSETRCLFSAATTRPNPRSRLRTRCRRRFYRLA